MKKELTWGYLSQFLQYGAALLILPLLLRKLSSTEVGIWYVFLTISTFVAMLDMGFTPTLARNVSYILAGATKLCKDGHEVVRGATEVDYGLLRAVIRAAKLIFLFMTVLTGLVLGLGGTWFIWHISKGQIAVQPTLVAWAVFSIATVINLYFKYYTPLLQGRGLFAEYYKSLALSNVGFVAVAAILLLLDWGLIGVTVGYLASAIIGRVLSGTYFHDTEFVGRLTSAVRRPVPPMEVALTLWSNSWRLGLVVVGWFLTLRANTLFASAFLDLHATAVYGLTLQIFTAIINVCMVVVTVQQQKLAALRVANQRSDLAKLTMFSQASALLLYVLVAPLVVLFGNDLIALAGGQTQMLSGALLVTVAVMFLLELSHTGTTVLIATGNTVPFWLPAILTGITIAALSLVGVHVLRFGLWWLVTAQFACQAAYNYWHWPQVLAREFEISYWQLIGQGTAAVYRRGRKALCSRGTIGAQPWDS